MTRDDAVRRVRARMPELPSRPDRSAARVALAQLLRDVERTAKKDVLEADRQGLLTVLPSSSPQWTGSSRSLLGPSDPTREKPPWIVTGVTAHRDTTMKAASYAKEVTHVSRPRWRPLSNALVLLGAFSAQVRDGG